MGKHCKQWQTLFWGAPKSLQMVIAAMKLKDVYSLEGKLWLTWIAYLKAETLLCQQRSVWSRLWFFQWSCMDVRVEYKESWAPKDWCFWTVVLEKTFESSLDCKEIQPVHPKGDQSWVFIGRTDFEVETPTLWPPDVKNWLTGKDPEAGKDSRWEETGMTEDEMVGWHHRCNRHEFGSTLGVGDGQWCLVCCSPWG